jgi:hypothetical protein
MPEEVSTPAPLPWGIATARETATRIDYYALIDQAVGRLRENTTERRRELYANAEAALLRELRVLDPPLSEPELAHEDLSFHKAVHRVETDWTLREAPPAKETKRERDSPFDQIAPNAPEVPTPSQENEPSEIRLASEPDPPQSWLLVKPPDLKRPASSIKTLILASVTVFIIGGSALTIYSEREKTRAFLVRTGIMQAVGNLTSLLPRKLESDYRSTLPAAQHAVLYEESSTDPQVKSYFGSVIWKIERVPEGEKQTPELTIHCSIEIPQVDLHLRLRFRRNTDKALSATHTIEIIFNSSNSTFRGISEIPGILMKETEQAAGERLAGMTINRDSASFVVGLSAIEIDKRHNLGLMKEQSWFDISIVYGTGQRAILAFQKGASGEAAFKEAFAEWAE